MPISLAAPILNASTNETKLAWCYLVGAWLLIAIPIFACHPAFLNSDTYQYIAVANYYLQVPHWRIQEAYTVGPVIPMVLAGLKGVGQMIFGWSRELDMAVVKLATLACYVVTTVALLLHSRRRGVALTPVALVVMLTLFVIPAQQDVVSLNAELVCSALFSLLIVVGCDAPLTRTRQCLFIAIAVLILYTKLQAVILLGICFYTFVPAASRSKLLIGFLVAFLGAELVLFFIGGGWMPKLTSLASYVGAAHTGAATAASEVGLAAEYDVAAQQFGTLWWAISQSLAFFPLALPLLFAGHAGRRAEPNDHHGRSAALWAIGTLVTILVPGRHFEHYVMFWLPFIVLSLGTAVGDLGIRTPRPWISLSLLVLCAVTKFFLVVPSADTLTNPSLTIFGPRQFISAGAEKAAQQIHMGPKETMFVHGWDYRYYCYFNKFLAGPGIMEGSKKPMEYAAELLATDPTYIFDVLDHSGLVRDGRFTLAKHPLWSRTVLAHYTKIFESGGLVIYRRDDQH